jgi:XrtJ-associated TM-motif-TM protein
LAGKDRVVLSLQVRQDKILFKGDCSYMKSFSRVLFFGSLFLIPALAHAQNGCVDSPECPTAILGIVGAAGAALYARFRSR